MQLEPALLSYAGLACLALGTSRARRDRSLGALPPPAVLRAIAALLLFLAAWRSVHYFGPYQGPVAFLAMISIAGLPLVLLLSRWPRIGLFGGIAAFAIVLGASLVRMSG